MAFIAIAAAAVIALIGRNVGVDSAIAAFDEAFTTALNHHATPGLRRFFAGITWFGIGWVLGIASALVAVGLLIRQRYLLAAGWILSQVGAVTLVRGVKRIVERARPDLPQTLGMGWSFPSGHAARTFAFCAMAVYVVYRVTRSRKATAIVAVLGLGWSLLMAFSRVYLGVHFASDVIAGMVVAGAWVAVCIGLTEEALRRYGARYDR